MPRGDLQHDWNDVRPLLAAEAFTALFGRPTVLLSARPDIDRLSSQFITAEEKFTGLGPYFFHPQPEVRLNAIRRCIDLDVFGFNLLLTLLLLDCEAPVKRYAALALWARLGGSGCQYAVRTIRQWCEPGLIARFAPRLTRDEALTALSRLARAAPNRKDAELLEYEVRKSFGESFSINLQD